MHEAPTHALGSIEPAAYVEQDGDEWAIYWRGTKVYEHVRNYPHLHKIDPPTPLYALSPEYLERVRAMEAIPSAQEFIEFAGDVIANQMVLTDHKRELGKAMMRSIISRWNAARRDARAALSNREDGDV